MDDVCGLGEGLEVVGGKNIQGLFGLGGLFQREKIACAFFSLFMIASMCTNCEGF